MLIYFLAVLQFENCGLPLQLAHRPKFALSIATSIPSALDSVWLCKIMQKVAQRIEIYINGIQKSLLNKRQWVRTFECSTNLFLICKWLLKHLLDSFHLSQFNEHGTKWCKRNHKLWVESIKFMYALVNPTLTSLPFANLVQKYTR